MRGGEAVERAAQQHGREQVADGEDELQVGDRLLGPCPVRRERGQRQPAEVLRRAKVGGRGWSSLASARVRVVAQPRLEEPGQRERQCLVRLGVGERLEVPVPLVVPAGRREPRGQRDQIGLVGARPAGGHLERFDVALAGDLLCHCRDPSV